VFYSAIAYQQSSIINHQSSPTATATATATREEEEKKKIYIIRKIK
jgi:hypothetical protein